MTTLVAVRLPDDLENGLEYLAKETGHSKSYYIKKALKKFLEDYSDYHLALSRLKEKNPTIPYEQIRKELGLED